MTAAPTCRSMQAPRGRRSTTRRRRSSTVSTSTTSILTASTAPSRTTPRSPSPVRRNGASSPWPTAPIPAPARAASSPSIPGTTTSSMSAPWVPAPVALQRYDHRTRQIQLVNVWPEESTGIAPKDLKYRFAWTFPIVFSPHDPGTLYVGGNCVFRSRDEGMSWQAISPDLSLNDRERQGASGGPITRESAGAEVHATCACVVESPHRRGEIWASTDDGLVQVTRDDGKSWRNVTPKGMPELAYVGCVEISAHDADTIYVAATRYKLADYKPYLFKSTDGGRSWKSIKGDLPADEITRVMRADPVARGLLYIGTETGIHFSLDDGASWTRMDGGLPVVPIYDLKLKDSDLVAATHGRSFWILDDVTALRGLALQGKPGGRKS